MCPIYLSKIWSAPDCVPGVHHIWTWLHTVNEDITQTKGAGIERPSTHLSECMPSVLLLCLLCMAYRSSPHVPALKPQITVWLTAVRWRPTTTATLHCVYFKLTCDRTLHYSVDDLTWVNSAQSPSACHVQYQVSQYDAAVKDARRSSWQKLPVWRVWRRWLSANQRSPSHRTTSALEICFADGGCQILLEKSNSCLALDGMLDFTWWVFSLMWRNSITRTPHSVSVLF